MINFCEFTRKCCKTVTVTDSVFMHGKLCIKLYTVNLDARLGIFSMESRTRVVVMEVVSQHLDQYKNNGLISKLLEILPGQI